MRLEYFILGVVATVVTYEVWKLAVWLRTLNSPKDKFGDLQQAPDRADELEDVPPDGSAEQATEDTSIYLSSLAASKNKELPEDSDVSVFVPPDASVFVPPMPQSPSDEYHHGYFAGFACGESWPVDAEGWRDEAREARYDFSEDFQNGYLRGFVQGFAHRRRRETEPVESGR